VIAGATRGGRRTAARVLGRCIPLLVATIGALAGCQSTKDAPPADPSGGNVEAKLVGRGGSVAGGSAVLHDVRGGIDMALWLGSAGPGEYRVAIHERGNCSSVNAFSAGAPWAPPGVPLAVVLFTKNDDTRTLIVRFPGYRLRGPDGVFGRAVVVHAGARGSLAAEPGVPNDRIACGVIGTPERLFPNLGQ
jgi:Cu-Zn family superoxide dismutase